MFHVVDFVKLKGRNDKVHEIDLKLRYTPVHDNISPTTFNNRVNSVLAVLVFIHLLFLFTHYEYVTCVCNIEKSRQIVNVGTIPYINVTGRVHTMQGRRVDPDLISPSSANHRIVISPPSFSFLLHVHVVIY